MTRVRLCEERSDAAISFTNVGRNGIQFATPPDLELRWMRVILPIRPCEEQSDVAICSSAFPRGGWSKIRETQWRGGAACGGWGLPWSRNLDRRATDARDDRIKGRSPRNIGSRWRANYTSWHVCGGISVISAISAVFWWCRMAVWVEKLFC